MIIIFSAVFAIFLFFFLMMLMGKRKKTSLKPKEIPNGVPITAKIISFRRVGRKYSIASGQKDHVLKLFVGLQITTENGDSWKAGMIEYMLESQLDMFHIGDAIHVKYDPMDKSTVVLDGDFHPRYHPKTTN